MMSWCRNGTYGQPSESGLRCRALFETAEPNTSKESPDQSLLKKLVSTWSSRKRDTNQMPRYKQVLGRSATSQSPNERRWTVRMQRAYPERLPHLPSRWCFAQQKAGIARPPSDSPWGMEKIREKCWIPHLRRLTKRVIDECVEYKRFQVTALANPPTGNVPKERTEGSVPFKSIGVDYAGPIKYFSKMWRHTFYYLHAAQPVPSVWIYYQIKQRSTCYAVWNVSWRDEDGQRKSSPIMGEPTFQHPNS